MILCVNVSDVYWHIFVVEKKHENIINLFVDSFLAEHDSESRDENMCETNVQWIFCIVSNIIECFNQTPDLVSLFLYLCNSISGTGSVLMTCSWAAGHSRVTRVYSGTQTASDGATPHLQYYLEFPQFLKFHEDDVSPSPHRTSCKLGIIRINLLKYKNPSRVFLIFKENCRYQTSVAHLPRSWTNIRLNGWSMSFTMLHVWSQQSRVDSVCWVELHLLL